MTTMHCEFCSNNLRFSHHENQNKTVVYDCKHCPVLVSFYFHQESSERIKTAFMIDRGDGLFIWTNNYAKECSYITDVAISISWKSVTKSPLVVKFPKIMNINPGNIKEQLTMYLALI